MIPVVPPLRHREWAVLVAVLCVTSVVPGLVAADPPVPRNESNGLTATESATLWSRDTDEYLSQAAYQQHYNDARTAMGQLANGTDITFTRPPAIAATWTRHDFRDLTARGADTSVYPPHANLTDGVYIRDAHATIFAVQPSTRGHLEEGRTPLYVAPNGTLRGFVDYRVRVPDGLATGNRTVEWSLVNHEIRAVRVLANGEPIVTRAGAHTPTLQYRLEATDRTTLRFAADIRVRLKKTTRVTRGGDRDVTTSYRTRSLTVSDAVAVTPYDLSVSAYTATYPNGDTGLAIFQNRPWQGYTLSADGRKRVRGVWRFYTASNPNWKTLVRADGSGRTTVASDAIPVSVHAYPSRIGPRAEPVRDGPTIVETWGTNRAAPGGTLGEDIHIDVVRQAYTTTYGVAVRTDTVDREAVTVHGIVRGVNTSLDAADAGVGRTLHRSTLTVVVIDEMPSQATLRITLRDAVTGVPIRLAESDRWRSITRQAREGYITVAGRRVVTNASGVATVTVTQPGIYTARYHPGSWLGYEPAYVGDTATTRWHPLTTLDGWFALLVAVGWRAIPFAVMLYAGTRLLRFLGADDTFQENL